MVEYHPNCIAEGKHRFALEQEGENVLLVLGVNPSTADENKPDPTMMSVLRFVNTFGYDGFVMLNLSSERATNPDNLSVDLDKDMHLKNLSHISSLGEKYHDADVLLAFGNNIDKRLYLGKCFYDIVQALSLDRQWLSIGGEQGKTKYGHPRHPLYASLKLGLGDFGMAEYFSHYEWYAKDYYNWYKEVVPQPKDSDPEWRWCLVGNIVKTHPYGESKEERQGTKQFAPGAKVYCAPSHWGDGYERIVVIGHPRHGKHLIQIVMPTERIENFRAQKVYKPAVLSLMRQGIWRWWDNSDSDYETITSLARQIDKYRESHKNEE